MKLGFGLYRQSLNQDNFRFAKQARASHEVVHLVDYFKVSNPSLSRGGDRLGWGVTQYQGKLWVLDELRAIKRAIEGHGLVWECLEYFLKVMVPVAEENGVRMADHRDDPPVDRLRGAARLVNQPEKYERLLNMAPSSSNALACWNGIRDGLFKGYIGERDGELILNLAYRFDILH